MKDLLVLTVRVSFIPDLSKNRFSELPEEVAEFVFLERLQCYHNAIRYIPDSISGLQCLNFLDLSRNQLTTLPREICQLPIQVRGKIRFDKQMCVPVCCNKSVNKINNACRYFVCCGGFNNFMRKCCSSLFLNYA